MKCKKINAAQSEAEKDTIRNRHRSCEHCSASYPNLDGRLCGTCTALKNSGTIDDRDDLSLGTVRNRIEEYDQQSSTHRLKQPAKQNASLKKAQEMNKKTSAMRATVKAENITTECSVQLMNVVGRILKSNMPAVVDTVKNTKTVNEVFESISQKAISSFTLSAWSTIVPVGYRLNPSPVSFSYAIGVINGKSYMVELDDKTIQSTIDEFFEKVCKSKSLAKVHQDARRLPLILTVPLVEVDIDDDDGDSHTRAKSAASKKRKSVATRSLPSSKTPRTSQYHSRWNPKPPFTSFKFQKSTYTLDEEGNATRHSDPGYNEILHVSNDFIPYACGNQTQKDGYLGKGLWKFAFKGRYKGQDVAVLQNHQRSSSNLENESHLDAELKLLMTGQWFLDSFKERAKLEQVVIPDMRWNSDGAFLAHLEISPNAEQVSCPPFNVVLVAPLLMKGFLYQEFRFSGNEQVGDNPDDRLGMAVDAFAHHIVQDTDGAMLFADLQGIISPNSITLFDPQAHTAKGDSGPWDMGEEAIRKFCREHDCTDVCVQMGLLSLAKFGGSGPLRIGFNK